MKIKYKRVFSFLMCLLMFIGLLPIKAKADEVPIPTETEGLETPTSMRDFMVEVGWTEDDIFTRYKEWKPTDSRVELFYLRVNYGTRSSSKSYPAGSVKITINDASDMFRSGSSANNYKPVIPANITDTWSYTVEGSNIILVNSRDIINESLSGTFNIGFYLPSRETYANYTKKFQAKLEINSDTFYSKIATLEKTSDKTDKFSLSDTTYRLSETIDDTSVTYEHNIVESISRGCIPASSTYYEVELPKGVSPLGDDLIFKSETDTSKIYTLNGKSFMVNARGIESGASYSIITREYAYFETQSEPVLVAECVGINNKTTTFESSSSSGFSWDYGFKIDYEGSRPNLADDGTIKNTTQRIRTTTTVMSGAHFLNDEGYSVDTNNEVHSKIGADNLQVSLNGGGSRDIAEDEYNIKSITVQDFHEGESLYTFTPIDIDINTIKDNCFYMSDTIWLQRLNSDKTGYKDNEFYDFRNGRVAFKDIEGTIYTFIDLNYKSEWIPVKSVSNVGASSYREQDIPIDTSEITDSYFDKIFTWSSLGKELGVVEREREKITSYTFDNLQMNIIIDGSNYKVYGYKKVENIIDNKPIYSEAYFDKLVPYTDTNILQSYIYARKRGSSTYDKCVILDSSNETYEFPTNDIVDCYAELRTSTDTNIIGDVYGMTNVYLDYNINLSNDLDKVEDFCVFSASSLLTGHPLKSETNMVMTDEERKAWQDKLEDREYTTGTGSKVEYSVNTAESQAYFESMIKKYMYKGNLGDTFFERDKEKYGTLSLRKYSLTRRYLTALTASSDTTIDEAQNIGDFKIGLNSTVRVEGSYMANTSKGYVPKFTEYVLLPEGAYVSKNFDFDTTYENNLLFTDGTKLSGEDSKKFIKEHTKAEVLENYNNTGRTVIKFTYEYTDNPLVSTYGHGVHINYKYYVNYESDRLLANGTDYPIFATIIDLDDTCISNVNNDKKIPYEDINNKKVSDIKDTLGQQLGLDNDRYVLYSDTEFEFNKFLLVEQSMTKLVKTNFTNGFTFNPSRVLRDSNYTYRLRIRTAGKQLTNVVIYDNLDNASGSDWRGTLVSIDTSYLEGKGYNPEVYYSTEDNAGDLDSGNWSTEYTNISDIKSIAIKLDKPLNTEDLAYVDINMKAPNDEDLIDKVAKNECRYTYKVDNKDTETITTPLELTLSNNIATVEISKKDSTSGDHIKGAVFNIYTADGKLKAKNVTTDYTGKAKVENLYVGDYYIEEVEAPQGYVLNNNKVNFTITEKDIDKVVKVSFENDRKSGEAEIYNVNNYGFVVKESTFDLYNSKDEIIYEDITLNSEGKFKLTNLPWGSYYLVQKSVPNYVYALEDNKIPFTISRDTVDDTVSVKIVNKQKPYKANIKVLYKEDDTPVSNVGVVMNTLQGYTGSNGVFQYVKEMNTTSINGSNVSLVSLPKGYERYNSIYTNYKYYTDIVDAPDEFTLYISRKSGTAKVLKVDAIDNVGLGATYTLYKGVYPDGVVENETFYSGSEYTLSDWGDYYLIETEAPKGYEVDNNPIPFTISADNLKVSLTHKDNRKVGKVEFTKTDTSGVAKKGALYNLYKADGTLVSKDLETDNEGKITLDNLEWGSYYLKEVRAPLGCDLSKELITFTISANNAGETLNLTAEDNLSTGSLRIIKRFRKDDLNFANGNPTFIFNITGKTTDGADINLTKTIQFTEDNTIILDNEEFIERTLVVGNIPQGDYVIKEKKVMRYGDTSYEDLSVNAETTNNGVKVAIGKEVEGVVIMEGSATFQSNGKIKNKFSDTSLSIDKSISNNIVTVRAKTKSATYGLNTSISKSDIIVEAVYESGAIKEYSQDDITFNTVSYSNYGKFLAGGFVTDNDKKEYFQVDINVSPFTYVIKDDNTIKITGYTDIDATVCEVPSEIGGLPVTELGEKAFYKQKMWYNELHLEKVTIPDTVTKIGNNCFYSLNLKEFEIPDSVTYIGDYAFHSCGLTEITIPDSVTDIGDYAFSGCANLKKVTLSKNMETLSNYLFAYCNSLDTIMNTDSIKTIGAYTFTICDSLNSIPFENVESIGEYSFSSCDNLSYVDFGDNLKSIGRYAFRGSALTDIYLPKGVELNEGCFYSTKLTDIDISNASIVDGYNMFYSCENLQSVILPSNLNMIDNGMFSNCGELNSIEGASNIEYIKDSGFYKCSKLISFDFSNIISMNYAAFQYSGIKEAVFSDKLKYLDGYCFADTPVSNVYLGNNITTIGSGCFSNTDNLVNITIPNSIKDIGSSAFWYSAVTNVVLPRGDYSIGQFAFCLNSDKQVIYCEYTSKPDRWDYQWYKNATVIWNYNGIEIKKGDNFDTYWDTTLYTYVGETVTIDADYYADSKLLGFKVNGIPVKGTTFKVTESMKNTGIVLTDEECNEISSSKYIVNNDEYRKGNYSSLAFYKPLRLKKHEGTRLKFNVFDIGIGGGYDPDGLFIIDENRNSVSFDDVAFSGTNEYYYAGSIPNMEGKKYYSGKVLNNKQYILDSKINYLIFDGGSSRITCLKDNSSYKGIDCDITYLNKNTISLDDTVDTAKYSLSKTKAYGGDEIEVYTNETTRQILGMTLDYYDNEGNIVDTIKVSEPYFAMPDNYNVKVRDIQTGIRIEYEYDDNTTTWSDKIEGAEGLKFSFTNTDLKDSTLTIVDSTGKAVSYTGTELSNKEIAIEGDTFTMSITKGTQSGGQFTCDVTEAELCSLMLGENIYGLNKLSIPDVLFVGQSLTLDFGSWIFENAIFNNKVITSNTITLGVGTNILSNTNIYKDYDLTACKASYGNKYITDILDNVEAFTIHFFDDTALAPSGILRVFETDINGTARKDLPLVYNWGIGNDIKGKDYSVGGNKFKMLYYVPAYQYNSSKDNISNIKFRVHPLSNPRNIIMADDSINTGFKVVSSAKAGQEVQLVNNKYDIIDSFKVNGKLIEHSNSFIMPDEDVTISDIRTRVKTTLISTTNQSIILSYDDNKFTYTNTTDEDILLKVIPSKFDYQISVGIYKHTGSNNQLFAKTELNTYMGQEGRYGVSIGSIIIPKGESVDIHYTYAGTNGQYSDDSYLDKSLVLKCEAYNIETLYSINYIDNIDIDDYYSSNSDYYYVPKGDKLKLINKEGKSIDSFKVNDVVVKGNTFTMPSEDVNITDIVYGENVLLGTPRVINSEGVDTDYTIYGDSIITHTYDANSTGSSGGFYLKVSRSCYVYQYINKRCVKVYTINNTNVYINTSSNETEFFYVTPIVDNEEPLHFEMTPSQYLTNVNVYSASSKVNIAYPDDIIVKGDFYKGNKVELQSKDTNKIIKSYKLNGVLSYDTDIVLTDDVEITDVEFGNLTYIPVSINDKYKFANYDTEKICAEVTRNSYYSSSNYYVFYYCGDEKDHGKDVRGYLKDVSIGDKFILDNTIIELSTSAGLYCNYYKVVSDVYYDIDTGVEDITVSTDRPFLGERVYLSHKSGAGVVSFKVNGVEYTGNSFIVKQNAGELKISDVTYGSIIIDHKASYNYYGQPNIRYFNYSNAKTVKIISDASSVNINKLDTNGNTNANYISVSGVKNDEGLYEYNLDTTKFILRYNDNYKYEITAEY